MSTSQRHARTGIEGLDHVLCGGLLRRQIYLLCGRPGAGKTTLGLHYALQGAREGERVLYVAMSETKEEIHHTANSHGWSLEGVDIYELRAENVMESEGQQTMFHPVEVELPRATKALLSEVQRRKPTRLVIDSLSEIRILARDMRWYRREVLLLKEQLVNLDCTMLLLDDPSGADEPVQSIVTSVIELEQHPQAYGADRRRLRVSKLRGGDFCSGYHDFRIDQEGMRVFPRLVAAESRRLRDGKLLSSGLPGFDRMLGGGLDRGNSVLFLGPTGSGKSVMASQFAVAAAERGERTVIYAFDEKAETYLHRAEGLGMDLKRHVDDGRVMIQEVDPGELMPGEFSHRVRHVVDEEEARLVVIDTLNGYFHAMPDARFLSLQMHELCSYLNHRGATVLMLMPQHGLPGEDIHSTIDLSYLTDTVILYRHFEHAGRVHTAVSVHKRRGGGHERTIREIQMSGDGLRIGETLQEFEGILTGVPRYLGSPLGGAGHEDD